MDPSFFSFPFFWVLIIIIAVIFSVASKQSREKQKAAWQRLAAAHNLKFVPNASFFSNGAYVSGKYRGHSFKLETVEKKQGRSSVTYTRLEISPRHQPAESPPSFAEALQRFVSPNVTYDMQGKIKAEADCASIYYEQQGVIQDVKLLESIINLLIALIEAYPVVAAAGAETIPKLHSAAKSEAVGEVVLQLLRYIVNKNTRQLAHRVPWLLCPTCLTRFGPHTWEVSWWTSHTYYGCRTCQQSQKYLEGKVVAVLDSQMGSDPVQQEDLVRVNWSARRELFDFDAVEIVEATDEDVERFAVQVGNDTDPTREPRYKEMPCAVASSCQLSANTIRILEHTFGKVEVN